MASKQKTLIPYGKQSISAEDIRAVAKALKKPLITRGELTETFERAIAEYCGAEHAVAFNSGSAALAAAMWVASLSAHDRLLTTPNTFISTVGTATQRGTTPIFVDIDRETGNMNLPLLLDNLNPPLSRGRVVVLPVHFAGIAMDMQKIAQSIERKDTLLIEDAAHALGSCYPSGERVGSCTYSDMTIFSFHPLKNITTGEGGMVTTPHAEYAHLLRRFRNNGIERDPTYLSLQEQGPWYYEVLECTNNCHMTEFQAALGLSQLARLDTFIHRRRQLVQHYRTWCTKNDIRCFPETFDAKTAYHLFVIQVDFAKKNTNRKEVMQQLMEQGIGTQYHYIPIYKHPVFAKTMGDLSPYFPEMEGYYQEALSLPLYSDLQDEEVDTICRSLEECLALMNLNNGFFS